MATTNTGQEGAARDFESKALHAGMLDLLGVEVADIIQISCLGFPKSDEKAPLAEMGMGILDPRKSVVICVGHNIAAPAYILDHMDKNGLFDKIEIAGLCCTAHDMTRYNKTAKIIGSMSEELKYIRSGVPDVLVTDEQCVRADILQEAQKLHIPVIATNEKITYGLPDRSNDNVDDIIDDLVSGKQPGVVLLDFEKIGALVPKLAMKIGPIRKAKGYTALPDEDEFKKLVAKCTKCLQYTKDCPESLPISDAMMAAVNGNLSLFETLHDKCVGCGRCDYSCPAGIPVLNVIEKASQRVIREEKGKMRIGRGQIGDPEIREEGRNLVLGTTPGVLAFVGCGNYPDGTKDVYDIVEEMIQRSYIIITSGCAAMDIGMFKDKDGKTLYERYPGRFVKGNLLNTGSCVSNAHIAATTIKVASIFAGRKTYLKKMPDDWHIYVRSEADLPVAKKEQLMKLLEEKGWKIDWEKKKILEGPLRKVDVSFQPTNVLRLCKEVKK